MVKKPQGSLYEFHSGFLATKFCMLASTIEAGSYKPVHLLSGNATLREAAQKFLCL